MNTQLSFDGFGINGNDIHKSRIATFTGQDAAKEFGPVMAAAPELLDFAKQFIDSVAWGDSAKPATVRVAELLQFARAAIAKAEGRS